MKEFSIITPSFNQAQYLSETIKSVADQSIAVQYLVIDGASTDNSIQVIGENIASIAYWSSEPDKGQSHAINKGLGLAAGEIINWLNSDDYYEKEALRKVKAQFTGNTRGVGGRSRLFNSQGTMSFSRGTDVYHGNLPKTIGWARIDQPETFFAKEAWDQVGSLNEDLHYCMDREWWMRYLYTFGLEGFKKIDDVLVNFRIHDDSKTSTAQPGFLKEHHSLFYAVAKVLDYKEALNWMEMSLALNTNFHTEISNWEKNEMVERSFNYYLLKSADEFYAQRDFTMTKGFLNLIHDELLSPEDRALFDKLKLRAPIGPIIKRIRP